MLQPLGQPTTKNLKTGAKQLGNAPKKRGRPSKNVEDDTIGLVFESEKPKMKKREEKQNRKLAQK